jgi:hypothetical protein
VLVIYFRERFISTVLKCYIISKINPATDLIFSKFYDLYHPGAGDFKTPDIMGLVP